MNAVNTPDVVTQADEPTKAGPSLGERIRALAPDHAFVRAAGPFGGTSRWQWTTPAGTWLVEAALPLFERGALKFTGGGATIALPATDAGFNALHAVMVALGAIGDEPAVAGGASDA